MPVVRYRDVRDVPPPAAVEPGDPALLDRVFAVCAFAVHAAGPLYPPGVSRFRSIEEANAAQEAALLERMRRRHAEPTDPGGRGGAR